MNDLMWDERLGISTESVDYSLEDSENYGYDPTGCRVIGIDHSPKLLEGAHENLERYDGDGNIEFVCSKAEDYCPIEANRFYLFNPFSTRVFRKVLDRIGESVKKNPREILIFFYYSTIEYKLYLPTEPRLELVKSVGFDAEVINSLSDGRLDVYRFQSV